MTTEFGKSAQGKKFLEHDVPRLAIAMENLAKAISESNKIEEKKLLFEKRKLLNENKHAGITRSSENRNES